MRKFLLKVFAEIRLWKIIRRQWNPGINVLTPLISTNVISMLTIENKINLKNESLKKLLIPIILLFPFSLKPISVFLQVPGFPAKSELEFNRVIRDKKFT